MGQPEPTSRLLRASTSAHHARVDERVRAVLTRGEAGRAAFLRASADVVVPWERELRRFAWPKRTRIEERLRKSAWLESDLGSLPEPRVIARAEEQAEAWGALYVLEGATLGASSIKRILPGGTARYLEGYGAETRAMWAAMQAALDEEVAGDAQEPCVRGAQRVFSHFEEALGRHG